MEITEEGQQAPVPKISPLEAGRLNDSQRTFDLSVIGKCQTNNDPNNELKLNIQGRDMPELFAVNDAGKLVYAQPQPMSVITMPRGHSSWAEISLNSVKGSDDYVKKYMCLGIFKKNEEPYILYMPDPDNAAKNHPSETIDLWSGEAIELVPLVSTTDLNTACTIAEPNSEVNLENVSVSAFDFSSVFRVDVKVREERWINRSIDLSKVYSNTQWASNGGVGVGLIDNRDGNIKERFLLVSHNNSSRLACSHDGIRWSAIGNLGNSNSGWEIAPVFGNNVWCVVNWKSENGIKRSANYGKSWSDSSDKIGAYSLHFAQSIFMGVTDTGVVYTSNDADHWTQIGKLPAATTGHKCKTLIYGNGRWICSTMSGVVCCSKDGKGDWNLLNSNLSKQDEWYGGCFVNGYFYVVSNTARRIMKSSDGEDWSEVFSWEEKENYYNIGYNNGKLYTFGISGTHCYIGMLD